METPIRQVQTCYHLFQAGRRAGELCGVAGRCGEGLCYKHRTTRSVSPYTSNEEEEEEEEEETTIPLTTDQEIIEFDDFAYFPELAELDNIPSTNERLNTLIEIRNTINDLIAAEEFTQREI